MNSQAQRDWVVTADGCRTPRGQASSGGVRRPVGSADSGRFVRRNFTGLEERRRAGMSLLAGGWRPIEVARVLGVSGVSVLRWKRSFASRGAEAWRRGRLGKPPKVTEPYLEILRNLLETSVTKHSYGSVRWTYRRLSTVMRELTGLSIHPDHLSRLIRRMTRAGSDPVVAIQRGYRLPRD